MALDLSHAAIIIGNFNSHLIAGHGPGRKSGHGDFNTLGAFHLAGVGRFFTFRRKGKPVSGLYRAVSVAVELSAKAGLGHVHA